MRLIDQPTTNQSSKFSLILANLIPIYGVLFLEWKVFDIIVFYWIETFIIGLFNVIKIMMCEGKAPKNDEESAKAMGPIFHKLYLKGKEHEAKNGTRVKKQNMHNGNLDEASKIFLSFFFLFHYNFFIFVQFILVFSFISPEGQNVDPFNVTETLVYIFKNTDFILIGIIGIIISHGYSLYIHFYKDEEYKNSSPGVQMFKPYVRIFVQQFVVIIGGGIAMIFNAPMIVLVLLVIFKIIVDLISHNYSHNNQLKIKV